MGSRGARRLALTAAILLVSACSRPSPPARQADATAPAASSPVPAAAAAQPGAPPSRPARRRPPATVEAYAAALAAAHDDLAKADAAYLQALRTAFQADSQPQAHAALVGYANTLQAQKADLPKAPQLHGCLGQAEAPALKAASQLSAAIDSRLAHVQSLSQINDRPLGLPDFGGVVASPAAARPEADQLRTQTDKARDAAAVCRKAEAEAAAARASADE